MMSHSSNSTKLSSLNNNQTVEGATCKHLLLGLQPIWLRLHALLHAPVGRDRSRYSDSSKLARYTSTWCSCGVIDCLHRRTVRGNRRNAL